MKLYGNNFSFNSNKVRFALNAMKLPYVFESVDLAAGQQRQPAFLKVNPVGRIPVLVDGPFTVFESNAIIRYLAEKTGSPLYPKSLEGRTLINQWLDFCSIHVGGAVGKIFFNTIVYKFLNAPKDENSLKEGRQFLNNFLAIIDAQLAKGPFLCGNEMSLADINLLAVLDPAEVTGSDLSAYPKVVAWRKKMQTQDFYTQVFPSFTEFMNGILMQRA